MDADQKKLGAGPMQHKQRRKQADSNSKGNQATRAAAAALSGLGNRSSSASSSSSIPVPRKGSDTTPSQTMNRGGPASASNQDVLMSRTPPGNRSQGARVKFEPYMDMGDLQRALKRGHALKAKFRLNAANVNEAYCTIAGLPSDILLRGKNNHNRAIEGDVVAVELNILADWFVVYKESSRLTEAGLMPDGDDDPLKLADRLSQLAVSTGDEAALTEAQQPWVAARTPGEALRMVEDILAKRPDLRVTGKVVYIIEPSPKRYSLVGVLLPATSAAAALGPGAGVTSGVPGGALVLVPLDPRLPKGFLTDDTAARLSQELREEAFAPGTITRTFVVGSIKQWREREPLPWVEVKEKLGPAGDLDSGTAALLAAENVLDQDFSLEAYACLPPTPWSISPDEVLKRRDLRSWRIFSIDPITARDLDDALSIEPLEGGRWRMGVHIADVASFVEPGSALDQEALLRGTSVYLAQRVIPMLPRLLCEQLCSLNPGQDRFAFSVLWEMDGEGHIQEEWVGRSIINSCGKLAYPMVQQMIEGEFGQEKWPQVELFNGATWDEVITDSLALHSIAAKLRRKRFEAGALRLNNTRLQFQMDAGSHQVLGYSHYIQQEANQLVEEFMLLANMRVAAFIADAFPTNALLRRHPPPNERKLKELAAAGDKLGLKIDISSAGALEASLNEIRTSCRDQNVVEVITMLTTKPMQLAQYFCTGEVEGRANWRHYALAVDMYTHFTSPIRRYPDVMVHRLLAAALDLRQQQQERGIVPRHHREQQQHDDHGTGSIPEPDSQPETSDWEEISQEEDNAASGDDGDSGDGASEAEALSRKVLEEHQISGPGEMEKVAEHSNKTKLSAKVVQEGSLKLCLCMLLRDSPAVVWGVVCGLGGDQFFTVYLPEFGFETRMYIDQMGLPLKAEWGDKTGVLTLSHQEEEPECSVSAGAAASERKSSFSRTNNNSSRRSGEFQRRGDCGKGSSSEQPEGGALDLGSPGFQLDAWLQSLKSLRNADKLGQVELPLKVRMFSEIPVVVGAYISKVTGAPVDVAAKLWVQGVPGKDVQQPAAAVAAAAADSGGGVTAAEGGILTSMLPIEALMDD